MDFVAWREAVELLQRRPREAGASHVFLSEGTIVSVIYLFHGSDTGKVRAKAFAWVAAARAKQPDAAYIRLEPAAISAEALAEAAGSQGLFYAKTLVLLDNPFETKDAADIVLEHLDILAQSLNPIAILAPKLLAARAKKIEAKAEKSFKIDAPAKAERGFNSALVDALGSKDGALLWKEVAKALYQGDAPEAVHGLLHWKARDMMQKGNRAWGKDGARKLSVELIELLSDSRGGGLELKEGLERWALSVS